MNFMKSNILSLAFVTFSTSVIAASAEPPAPPVPPIPPAPAEHKVDLSSIANVRSVVVSNFQGDITIEGTDESGVRILGDRISTRKKENGPPPEGFRSLRGGGVDNTGLGVQVSNQGGTLSIVGVPGSDGGDISVFLPRALAVSVTGVFEGDVVIRGISAEINVNIHEGDLLIEDVTGPVVAHSVDGDVEVSFISFTGDRESVINSVDGEVSVALPGDARVTLEIMTIDGDILTDLPVEVKLRDAHMFHGPQNVVAELNGGGTKLKIHSIENDVVIKARGREKEEAK